LASIITQISKFIPSRRKRKLHIGLFGYSRNVSGISLPRAITFTAALYSIGIPPEVLGLIALDEKDIEFIKEVYINFEEDLKDALEFYNPQTPFLKEEIKMKIKNHFPDYKNSEEHQQIVSKIIDSIKKNKIGDLPQLVILAANERKFLG
jgi:phosphoenolpyruvate carboxylase